MLDAMATHGLMIGLCNALADVSAICPHDAWRDLVAMPRDQMAISINTPDGWASLAEGIARNRSINGLRPLPAIN